MRSLRASGSGCPILDLGPFFLAVAGMAVLATGAGGQTYPIWTINGSGANEYLGTAVAGVGDVNGDGFNDILAGIPYASPGGLAYAGQAKVYSGATGAPLMTFSGTAQYERLGAAVAAVGDVNGDGAPDFAVGIPYATPAGLSSAGRVRIFSGAGGSILLTVNGLAAYEALGYSVAGTGDLNGDGVPDFVAGMPTTLAPGCGCYAGLARVYSGADGTVLRTLQGTSSYDAFGAAVAGAGDVDADGVPDVIVGAPHPGAGKFVGPGPGFAKVFSGATGAVLHTFVGAGSFDTLGTSVAGPGDLNGDGFADVAVGAPGAYGVGYGSGRAYVYSGGTGAALYTYDGSAQNDWLGCAVAAAGDLDGDGVPDLLVGARLADPGGLLQAGQVKILSGATGAVFLTINGSVAGQELGASIAAAGDVNADGVPDVIAGAPNTAVGPNLYAGQVKVGSLVGLPTGTSLFGSGCAGSGGLIPQAKTFGGPPSVGNGAFGVSMSRGIGTTFAVLFAGSLQNPGGIPMDGCTFHLAGNVFIVGWPFPTGGKLDAPGTGYRLVGIPVPAVPALVGGAVHLQWQVLDSGSPNGAFSATGGLSVTIL